MDLEPPPFVRGARPPSETSNSDTRYASSNARLQDHPYNVYNPEPPPPSLRSGRSQSLAIQTSTVAAPPIRRKPLSATASKVATQLPPQDQLELLKDLPRPDQRFSRSYSIDSPTLYEFPAGDGSTVTKPLARKQIHQAVQSISERWELESDTSERSFAPDSRHPTSSDPQASPTIPTSPTEATSPYEQLTPNATHSAAQEPLDDTDLSLLDGYQSSEYDNSNTHDARAMSLFARKPTPPHLHLGPSTEALQPTAPVTRQENKGDIHKPLPRSPASSKLGTFFGWATSPSVSEFSDKGYSPIPSPYSQFPTGALTDEPPLSSRAMPNQNALATDRNPIGYCEDLQTPPASTPSPPAQIDEMEDELKAISVELASSIRREIDLEDLVEKLQAEINNPPGLSKRTSDYFSDSVYSSAKFSDYDASKEEIATIQRRAEQEKAQLRLELTDKLTDERTRRKVLDQQIKELAQKASTLDLAHMQNEDASGRVRDLENTCEDLRRRISEEREVKNNFEDLLSALKGELQSASNERDNLRDEIVPQLRARVEGLEAEAAEQAKLAYDTSKMQQELQNLKLENTSLKHTSINQNRFSLVRSKSNSITSGSGFKVQQSPLARSNTVRQGPTETREALAERLKDVEAQRDALHAALKNLLDRQEFQNRENDKKVRVLEVERDRLLTMSPKKAGYEKEVANLRDEINVLRRRAEEAIEQKWQVEKGLGGLKMDLDRAEQEITSLRSLLNERDVIVPSSLSRASSSSDGSLSDSHTSVTSETLEMAYRDLQMAYSEALERIKSLELGGTTSAAQDERTNLAMQRLEQSLSTGLAERDNARDEAGSYREQLDELQAAQASHLQNEQNLASQLEESARRVEELAQQVRSQLALNTDLRSRLSDAIARGEAEQSANKVRITRMQERLRSLEDQLITTQTAAEERVSRHEEEIASLKESHHGQLRRLRDSTSLRSPTLFPPKSPLSPMIANPAKSPGLLNPRPTPRRTQAGPAGEVSAEELERVETLKARVGELEGALALADAEMQQVVGKMNTAQIEVMQLQEERETAARETRKLQRMLETEQVKTFQQRFQTLGSS